MTIERTGSAVQNIDALVTISWDITFNEPVTQVGVADFTVTTGGIVGTIDSADNTTGNTYTVTATLTAPSQATNLEIHLRTSNAVDIIDASNNRFDTTIRDLTMMDDSHYILNIATTPVTPPTPPTPTDTTNPTIMTIARTSNTAQNINSLRTISWTITFSESVTRVGTADFTVDVGNIVGTIGVSGSGASYTVTATLTAPTVQSTNLPIHLRPSTSVDIEDSSGNPFATTPRNLTIGDSHYILNTSIPSTLKVINRVLIPSSPEVIESRTEDLIVSFASRQAAQILTNTPSLHLRTARSTITSGSIDVGPQSFTADVTNEKQLMDYTGSFLTPFPTLGDIDLFGGTGELWTSLSYSTSNFENGDKSTSIFSTSGIDYLLTPKLLLGVSFQLDSSDQSESSSAILSRTYTSTIESQGWLASYYSVYEFNNSSFEFRAGIGSSDAEFAPFGSAYKDEYSTERSLLSFGFTRKGYRFNDGSSLSSWSIIPRLNYTYYTEVSDSYVDSSGGPLDYRHDDCEHGIQVKQTRVQPDIHEIL